MGDNGGREEGHMDMAQMRQELHRMTDRLEQILAAAFERRGLVAGRVYVRRSRCGKPTCHCATGELHSRLVFTNLRGKPKVFRTVDRGEERELRKKTEAYRRVRTARAEFRRWSREVTVLLDAMERARTEPTPERTLGEGGGRCG